MRAEGDELELVAPDRPGLFARVAGVLALHGLDVLTADATAEDAMALERFRVTSKFSSMVAWDRVETDLMLALDSRLAIEARLRLASPPYSQGRRRWLAPASIRFDDRSIPGGNGGRDQRRRTGSGSLYRVLRAFTGLDLDVRVAEGPDPGRDGHRYLLRDPPGRIAGRRTCVSGRTGASLEHAVS